MRGQPTKAIGIRIPLRLLPDLETEAAARGVGLSAYLSEIVVAARDRDMPTPPDLHAKVWARREPLGETVDEIQDPGVQEALDRLQSPKVPIPLFVHAEPKEGETPEDAVDRVLGEPEGRPLHALEAEHDAYLASRTPPLVVVDEPQTFEPMQGRFQVVEQPPSEDATYVADGTVKKHHHRRKGTGDLRYVHGVRQELGVCSVCGEDLGWR